MDAEDGLPMFDKEGSTTPESHAAIGQLSALLEESILMLPVAYRAVLVLRDLEEMSTAETAQVLEISDGSDWCVRSKGIPFSSNTLRPCCAQCL